MGLLVCWCDVYMYTYMCVVYILHYSHVRTCWYVRGDLTHRHAQTQQVQHKCGIRSNLTASGVDGCLPKFIHLWERHNRPKDAWCTGGLPPTVPHWMPVAVKCTSFHPSSIYSTLPPPFATGRSTQQLLLCGGVRGRPCAVTPLLQMYVYSGTV